MSAGLRAPGSGAPSFAAVASEHEAYVAALRRAGLQVAVLDALEDYPDAVFVEDPALVFPTVAIVLRNRAATRAGEAAALRPALCSHFPQVVEMSGPGHVDGGDVLVCASEVLIGLSARTDDDGARTLAGLLSDYGLHARIVAAPAGVLHLKSACSLLDARTVLCTKPLEGSGIFASSVTVVVPDDERGAANALRINDVVLLGAEYPRTAQMLSARGYEVVSLPTREISKLDAGLSCMSLRWRASRPGAAS